MSFLTLTTCERREKGQKKKVLAHYLEYPWNFSGICTVHISMSDRSDMKQLTVGGIQGEVIIKMFVSKLALKDIGSK